MSAPIKREDIRTGDRVRLSFEFTACSDYAQAADDDGDTYELIERPVVLPTEPGVYAGRTGSIWVLKSTGEWLDFSLWSGAQSPLGPILYLPLTRLRTEAEVAAEVLKRVQVKDNAVPYQGTRYYTAQVAAEYGVTL